MSRLSFAWKERFHSSHPAPVAYRAFVIDRWTLNEHFRRHSGRGSGYVSPFGWLQESFTRRAYDQLLGRRPSPLPSGRVPLQICGECADLGCGFMAVRIEHHAERVVWHDFAYENNYNPEDTTPIVGMPRYTFVPQEYADALDGERRWPPDVE